MAHTTNGKDRLAFFRLWENRTKDDAARIRFQTEHEVSSEMETDTTTTKDGSVNSIADGENSIEFTSIAYVEDDADTINMWKEMRRWYRAKKLVEAWDVDLSSARENKDTGKTEYDVDYYQGRLTEFSLTAPSDEVVELKYTLTVDGTGVEGKDTLTEAQQAAVEAAQYAYHTLAKETDA